MQDAIRKEAPLTETEARRIWASSVYRWHAYAYEGFMTCEELEEITIEWQRTDNEDTIASVHITRIPYEGNPRTQWLFEKHRNMKTWMDDESGDLAVIAECIFDTDTGITREIRKQLTENDLYYVGKIHVIPELRDSGFGTYILKNLHQILAVHAKEANPVVMLIPSAIEYERPYEHHSEEWHKMTDRLTAWYRRNGFVCVKGYYGKDAFVLKESLSWLKFKKIQANMKRVAANTHQNDSTNDKPN